MLNPPCHFPNGVPRPEAGGLSRRYIPDDSSGLRRTWKQHEDIVSADRTKWTALGGFGFIACEVQTECGERVITMQATRRAAQYKDRFQKEFGE